MIVPLRFHAMVSLRPGLELEAPIKVVGKLDGRLLVVHCPACYLLRRYRAAVIVVSRVPVAASSASSIDLPGLPTRRICPSAEC